jgi:serine/threonine-protein kinase
VAGLLLVAVLAIIAWVLVSLLDNDGDKGGNRGSGQGVPSTTPAQPGSNPPQATQAEPTQLQTTPTVPATSGSVTVRADGYRGGSAADAADDLTSRGLRPEVVDQDGQPPDDARTCLVTDVSPTGAVPIGSSVTVTCLRESG